MSTETKPTAAAMRAETAITSEYSVGTASRFCDDPPDFDSAQDGALATIIDAQFAGLVDAAEELIKAESNGSFAHISHAKAQLREEILGVKGSNVSRSQ